MQLAGSESWQVKYEIPEELQFAAYLGRQHGFSVPGASTPASRLWVEAEWRRWWSSLIGILPAGPHMSGRQTEPLTILEFDPPDFQRLGSLPALQALCRPAWPVFDQAWGGVTGQKRLMAHLLLEQIKQARVNEIVDASIRAAGKAKAAQFEFRVDFLIWPEDYHVAISEQHIVLGRTYLELSQIQALRRLLQNYIRKLV